MVNRHLVRAMLVSVGFFYIWAGVMPAGANQPVIGGAEDLRYPYHARPNEIPAGDFARNDAISDAKLSPDGSHMLAVFPVNDYKVIRAIAIQPEAESIHFSFSTESGSLEDVHWLDNRRIMVQTRRWRFDRHVGFIPSMMVRVFDRHKAGALFVHNFDIRSSEALVFNAFLNALPNDPDHILITVSPDGKKSPGVYKLNIVDGSMEEVEAPQKGVSVWMADDEGNVRLGYGVEDDEFHIIAKPTKTSKWTSLHNKELFKDGRFFPVRFGFDGKSLIVRSAVANGRFAFYRFSLTKGRITGKIFEHPSVDVLGLEVSPSRKTLLAVTYMEDTLHRHFLDDAYRKLFAGIDRALPDRSNYLLSQSRDGRFLLIKSVSDLYPGAIYRLDTKTNEMDVVNEVNRWLDPRLLSPTKRIDYYARDGLEIPAYITRPIAVKAKGKLPAIILPHGGPMLRDTAEYDRMAQFLASRGYLVLQPNYRGSTGYSFEYQSMGFGQWGGDIQNDIEDAAKYLIKEGLADPKHICIVGRTSFDAYSALLGVLRTPGLFACAVSISPIADLDDYSDSMRHWYGRGASMAIKGRRSSRDIKAASPIRLAKSLKRPLLLFYGAHDRLVPAKQIKSIDKKFRKSGAPYTLLLSREEGHGISLPGNRAAFYKQMDTFLGKYLGRPDESGFVLRRKSGLKDKKASIAAAKARASQLSENEVLKRCVPSHFRPFVSILPALMLERIGYCSSYLHEAKPDTNLQTLVTAYLTRAKLYYLKDKYEKFGQDLAKAKALAAKAPRGQLDTSSRLAIDILESLSLARQDKLKAATQLAAKVSAEAPDYLAGHQTLLNLARQSEDWENYLLARRRALRLNPNDYDVEAYIYDLLSLGRFEAVKETIATELPLLPHGRIQSDLLLAYLEVLLRQKKLNDAAILVAAFENPKKAAADGSAFPGHPSLKFSSIEIPLRNARQSRLRLLKTLYYFDAGQPDKAKAITPKDLDDCVDIVCWKINQHFAALAGKTVEVKSLQRLIDRRKDHPHSYDQTAHAWQVRVVRSLPGMPVAALSGQKTPPDFHRMSGNGDRLSLFFDSQPPTDEYASWQAIEAKAAAVARQKGASGYIIQKAGPFDLIRSVVNWGSSYTRHLSPETKVDILLVHANDTGKAAVPDWMVHQLQ